MSPAGDPARAASAGRSRYELLVKIGTGGTATVYIGRLRGMHGFSRLVAIKRAHPHLVGDPAARRMLVREATLASRINHANVVPVQDVEENDEGLLLVMDYVEGASLAELLEAGPAIGRPLPASIAVKIVLDACAGLAAAHDLAGDDGRPLGLAHRDVSPQNILVGIDGTARITDFGIAKFAQSVDLSRTTGSLRGKPAYLAPEYLAGGAYSVACDVFAMGVVAWEALTGARLFRAGSDPETIRRVLEAPAPPVSRACPELGTHLDNVVAKALEKQPSRRYEGVSAFAIALEAIARRHDLCATSWEVASYVRAVFGARLEERRSLLRAGEGEGGGKEGEAGRQGDEATGGDTVSLVGPRAALLRALDRARAGERAGEDDPRAVTADMKPGPSREPSLEPSMAAPARDAIDLASGAALDAAEAIATPLPPPPSSFPSSPASSSFSSPLPRLPSLLSPTEASAGFAAEGSSVPAPRRSSRTRQTIAIACAGLGGVVTLGVLLLARGRPVLDEPAAQHPAVIPASNAVGEASEPGAMPTATVPQAPEPSSAPVASAPSASTPFSSAPPAEPPPHASAAPNASSASPAGSTHPVSDGRTARSAAPRHAPPRRAGEPLRSIRQPPANPYRKP